MGQSRRVILVVIALLSFVVPAVLCLAVALASVSSVLLAGAVTLTAATWLTLLLLVNWWEFSSIHLRWAWAAVFATAVGYRAINVARLPASSPPGLGTAALTAVWVAGAWALVNALRARRPAAPPIDLAFPLAPGTYLATDGGDGARSALVNYHYGFGQHRAAGVNASMRYAVDLVAIGAGGCESRGFLPASNGAYRIWRRPLLCPSDGRIVSVVDGVADNAAFGSDRPYGVGNHIVVKKAADVYLVLGHLAEGSVRVVVGQVVRAGDQVGNVGNSGWTERPHLHMQAMRSANGDWWHGEPVPFSFAGRFPVRNRVFRA